MLPGNFYINDKPTGARTTTFGGQELQERMTKQVL
jgi:hypothetical protein